MCLFVCFNPCFNGSPKAYKALRVETVYTYFIHVSILVLMDKDLVHKIKSILILYIIT
jgi:hypothetical protein